MVLEPETGAVLAITRTPPTTPTHWPHPTSTQGPEAGRARRLTADGPRGLRPGLPAGHATTRFAPGSTFKVVTSTAVYNLEPEPDHIQLPGPGLHDEEPSRHRPSQICNDATTPAQRTPAGARWSRCCPSPATPATPCSASTLGPTTSTSRPSLFGYNTVPPIDLNPGRRADVELPDADRPQRRPARPGRRAWPTRPSASRQWRRPPCRTPWWPRASPTQAW